MANTCPNGHRNPRTPCDCAACFHDRRAMTAQDQGDHGEAQRQYTAARRQASAEHKRNADTDKAARKWWRR